MSWKRKMRDAKFRGVSFSATTHSTSHGRRGTDYEFPERDEPYASDTGKRQRRYTVNGFIAGDDYLRDLKKMVAAAEREGAAELIHPVLGSIMVVCRDLTWQTGTDDGGLANISLDLVEAGALANPTEAASTAEDVANAATALLDATEDDFGALDDVVTTTAEASRWTNDASDKLEYVAETVVGPFVATVDNVAEVVLALQYADELLQTTAATPSVLAARVRTSYDILTSLSVCKALSSGDLQAEALTVPPAASDATVQEFTEGSRAMLQRFALGRQADLLRLEDFTSKDQAEAERDALSSLIDAELLLDPSDAVAAALIDLRTAVARDIDTRAQDLPSLETIEIAQPRTSLSLAQELYGDAERSGEIVIRNNAAHPAFMVGALEVLSE